MSNSIIYIPEESLEDIFKGVENYLQRKSDPIPHYSNEIHGINRVKDVLKSIEQSYYPDFYSKASYLFLSINKGHFFSNGNKRLATTLLKIFYTINGFEAKENPLPDLKIRTNQNVPNLEIDKLDVEFFNNDEELIFLYGLAKAIAKLDMLDFRFDKLKEIVEEFLRDILE